MCCVLFDNLSVMVVDDSLIKVKVLKCMLRHGYQNCYILLERDGST
jgi:hypothetical protein